MQSIVRDIKNIHSVFDDIERFYMITSDVHTNTQLVPPVFDSSFEALAELFEVYGKFYPNIELKNKQYNELKVMTKNENDILVAFSGGKDSTATALYYKDKGYNVTLYHLRGINQTYKDEWKTSQEVAKILELPLIMETVSLKGGHCWIEHPMKNMIIANSMIQHCLVTNVYPNIAFGNFLNSDIKVEPFDVCGGDCFEMWLAYEDIIARIIPDFEIQIPLDTMKDTWSLILMHKEVIEVVQSCIGPYRYREYLKKHNEEKYHIKLFDHHCGSCWKCALEYCVYADNDLLEYNAEYYKHCLEILKKTYKREYHDKPTIDDIFYTYFPYEIEKSKFLQDDF